MILGLKDADRKLAAPRIWLRFDGAAKNVVRPLGPREFDSATGLERLLDVLRQSPLRKLPVPDSFSRLERWTGLLGSGGEEISNSLVREEELFVELQQALRVERAKAEKTSTRVGARERDPSESPSAGFGGVVQAGDEVPPRGQASFYAATSTPSPTSGTLATDSTAFFENELRGYRVLKAARLSGSERHHVMTLTRNSTHFNLVRQALRSLFSEDFQDDGIRLPRKTWYMQMLVKNGNLDGMKPMVLQPRWSDDASWEDAAYWADWTSPTSSWGDAWNYYEDYDNTAINEETYSQMDRSGEETEEDKETEEAYQLAVEANRTSQPRLQSPKFAWAGTRTKANQSLPGRRAQ